MGYFMDEPRVYRIKYSQSLNQGEMRLEVDLGFSSETKEPGVGDFTFFALEKSKPTTFREALKEYYDKCPQYFEDKNFLGRDREHGMWTLWMQKNVFAPWDFQIGYNQIQANREDVEEKGLAGWQEPVLSYTEPWGIYQMFPVKDGYKRDIQAFVYNPLETPELERMLKKHASADPNLIDQNGNNPSFYVGDNTDILKLLLHYKCNVHNKNIYGISSFELLMMNPSMKEILNSLHQQKPE